MTGKKYSKSELKRLIRKELKESGFFEFKKNSANFDKDGLRRLHVHSKKHEVERRLPRIKYLWEKFNDIFISSRDLDVESIDIKLIPVEKGNNKKNEIFWLSRMYWSLPYSQGFGRRLRFLVWDEHHDKLVGLIGLQSPPLDFKIRDRLFDYPKEMKTYYVNQTMDAYTIGALPPYSYLLSGKLVAMLMATNEVRSEYRNRYEGSRTHMSDRVIPANLVAITTTSAFGKSAMYDRLRDREGNDIVRSIGLTEQTTGSYHFNGLYLPIRDFLLSNGLIDKSSGYGTGPRIRWQIIQKGLKEVGLSKNLIKHNIPREVFLVSNLENLDDYLAGRAHEPAWIDRSSSDLISFWRERWMVPRYTRITKSDNAFSRFMKFQSEEILSTIIGDMDFSSKRQLF